jgi:predicted nucleic acid-binding protein
VAKAKAKDDPPPLIYVDTCVYLDLLTKRETPHADTGEPRWRSAKALFDAINDGRVTLAASALVEAEVGCFSLIRDGGQAIQDQLRGWFDALSTKYAEVDRFMARQAARLSKVLQQQDPQAKQLRGADGIHLAAAIRLGCDYLMTHDAGFPLGQKVEGVEIRRTETVWVATLDDMYEE